MKVLVSAGGTAENIDGVRKISNISTGNTGRAIAISLLDRSYDLYFFHAENVAPIRGARNFCFSDFDSLNQLFESKTPNDLDWIVHAAAVSDYKLSKLWMDGQELDRSKKISSQGNLKMELVPTKKIITEFKNRFPSTKIFAFKFTNTNSPEERIEQVKKLFVNAQPHFILHNDAQEKNSEKHEFVIYDKHLNKKHQGQSTLEIVDAVLHCLEETK